MTVWRTPPVSTQPEIVLTRWRIFETPEGTRHFCGYHARGLEGRVSSRIIDFDLPAMIGITRSGRTYQLEGESADHPDAEYVLGRWCLINNVNRSTLIFIKPQDMDP